MAPAAAGPAPADSAQATLGNAAVAEQVSAAAVGEEPSALAEEAGGGV